MRVGVQIINENWFEAMCNHSLDNFPSTRKPVVKHIPIKIYSEVDTYAESNEIATSADGKLHYYLVTVKE